MAKKAVKRRKPTRQSSYIYHVEASYPASQYPTKDAPITRMAKAFGGIVKGSGMGFGYRDLGFLFKTRTAANKFISKLKVNRIRRSGIIDWSKL